MLTPPAPTPTAADPVAEFLRASGLFDADWYQRAYDDVAASGLDPLEHYLAIGLVAGRSPNARLHALHAGHAVQTEDGEDAAASPPLPDEAERARIDAALLGATGAFDRDYYLANNPDVERAGADPLLHFCRHGWKELRNPAPDFDVWWYWMTHLDPTVEAINPRVHQVLFSRARALPGRPGIRPPAPAEALAPGARRICLFAGYDPDGLVDDYVVRFVRELSRHADVYYLADCAMAPGELDRLAPYTKGAWAERHGTYDFGSWSRLARELVGWDTVAAYDELLLVNDSCYLVRPLDDVFAKMDATRCAWWGLQATKGIAATRDVASNRFAEKIPIARVRDELVAEYERDYTYDFLVGSYFLGYRRPVIDDPLFRRLLSGVVPQRGKKAIIQKYEIGLTHLLVSRGHAFSTFCDWLHPFHPIFSANHFALLGEGFPVFKRYLLSDNHYQVADLSRWKDRVLEAVPDAPVEEMERNLLRVADADKLERSFSVVTGPDGLPLAPKLLSAAEMTRADGRTPKFDHWWAFPVCAFDHLLTGNERAVFEQVRHDPSIRKIVLTRKRRIDLDGENVVVCPLESPQGQYYLLRSKQVFVKHSPTINARYALSGKLHNFINLWHGIPLKRFGPASLDMEQNLDWVYRENRNCRAVISSSKVDAMAMAAAFYPLPYRDVWVTGLPRNDFIVCPASRLPADFVEEGRRLEAERGGRRLVLFAPTFKNAQAEGYYRFSEAELEWLRGWMAANEVVLGVREHMADSAHAYRAQLAPLGVLDLSSRRYPNIEVLYRQASMLVTDYSSCAIDFMLTGRPSVSFAYDLAHYAGTERGLFYDLEHVFPGPVCRDFAALCTVLERFGDGRLEPPADLDLRRRTFFDHLDDGSAWRVVGRVRALALEGATPMVRC